MALPSTSASHDKAIISDSLLQEMHCVIRKSCSDSAHNILAGFSNNPYTRLLVKNDRKLSFSFFVRKAVGKAKLLWYNRGWEWYIVDGYLILLQVLVALCIAGKGVEELMLSFFMLSFFHLLFSYPVSSSFFIILYCDYDLVSF